MPIVTASAGAPLPEYPDRRWYKVIAPVGKYACKVTLLSTVFRGFWTHWIKDEHNPKGKVVPCGPEGACGLCKRGNALRWTGYQAAFSWQFKDPRVVAFTEAAARQIQPVFLKFGNLRGHTLTLKREQPWPNAPVLVTFHGQEEAEKVPADFDIMPSLNRMWGLSPNFKHRIGGAGEGHNRIDRHPDNPAALDRPRWNRDGEEVA